MAELENQEKEAQGQETEQNESDPMLDPNAYDEDLALLNEQAGGQHQEENVEERGQQQEQETQSGAEEEEETAEEETQEEEETSSTGDQKVDNILRQISENPEQFAKNYLNLRKDYTQKAQKLSEFTKGSVSPGTQGTDDSGDIPDEIDPFSDLQPGNFRFTDFQKKYGGKEFIEPNQEFFEDMGKAIESTVTEKLIVAGQRMKTAEEINSNTKMIRQRYPEHQKHYHQFLNEMRKGPNKIVSLADMFEIFLKKKGLLKQPLPGQGGQNGAARQHPARFGKKAIGPIVNSPAARSRVNQHSVYGDKSFDDAFGD